MTKEECAIVSAYTGYAMLQGDDLKYLYEYIDKITNGKYGFDLGIAVHSEEVHRLAKADFIELCRNAI